MEKNVDGMVARRIQPEHLAIELIRKPGDRVPVQSVRGAKSPKEGIPAKPGTNLGIVGDVNRVVVIEKWSVGNGVIKRKSCEHEQQAENQSALLRDLKSAGPNRMPNWL